MVLISLVPALTPLYLYVIIIIIIIITADPTSIYYRSDNVSLFEDTFTAVSWNSAAISLQGTLQSG
jgi:hypothetical protein